MKSDGVVVFVQPRALRPPEAGKYIAGTRGLIESPMRGLKYKLIGGSRAVLIEELDRYLESLPDETGPRREAHQATAARRETV